MQQIIQNSLNYIGSASEESTDSPSHDSKPTYSVVINDDKYPNRKKIFYITKTRNKLKTAKQVGSKSVQETNDNSNISVTENDELISKLFFLRKKYKATLISMKVVL